MRRLLVLGSTGSIGTQALEIVAASAGGELVTQLAEATGAQIIPVDSEHSALAQLIAAERPGTVERLVLTASGGPFRGRTDLGGVTVEEAPAHPTWQMG